METEKHKFNYQCYFNVPPAKCITTKVAQFSEKCACSEWSNTSAFFAHTTIEWLGSDGSRSELACARAHCTIIMVEKMSFVSVEAINTMRSSNC